MDLCREADIISEIREGRLRWLGEAERLPEERTVDKVFRISKKEKGPLESLESDSWTMLEMI
jgi:hypothetical protein